MATPQKPKKLLMKKAVNIKFRSDINGLRALAVIFVVLFHFDLFYFKGGFVGVDIFFVISGFLMTTIITKGVSSNKFSFISFYKSRAQRIVPALAAVCLATAAIGWFTLLPSDYKALGKHGASSLLFASNIIYFLEAGYFDTLSDTKLLLHTWSLSIEWQFYLVFPVLLYATSKYIGEKYLLTCLILLTSLSFGIAALTTSQNSSASFYLIHTRFWELAFGGIIFFLSRKNIYTTKYYSHIGLALVLTSALTASSMASWPSWQTLLPVIGTGLIILAHHQTALFNNATVNLIGKSSYSIYLWHWPIAATLNKLSLNQNHQFVILGITLSFILGYLSYRFIEIPSLSSLRNKEKSRLFRINYIMESVVFISILAALSLIFTTKGLPFRVSEAALIADNERFNSITKDTSNTELATQELAKSEVVLMGDSIASAVSATFEDSFPENTVISKIIKRGCPFILNAEKVDTLDTKRCSSFTNHFFEKLTNTSNEKRKKIVIINSFGYWPENRATFIDMDNDIGPSPLLELFAQRFVESTCKLQNKHDVFVVLPIPGYPKNVPSSIGYSNMFKKNTNEISISREAYQDENKFALNAAKAAQLSCNINLLDPANYLCDKYYCYASKNQRPLYYDNVHLSIYGAKILKPMFLKIPR
jgi:peptidoglycan/LPS O-acetylase OafA/YrhL